MSGIEDLLSRSRTPGTFVERREFTLSRDKAVEKLREFSLRHQAGYVLELVQAAVFAGATYIAIDITDQELLVAWVGGRSCTAAQLEQIFDYLFVGRTDPRTRHLSQLAIGLNALLQRKPKLVRIESGDGTAEGTVRVDLDRRGDGTLGRPQLAMAGTYLLVQFASSWLSRFDAGEQFHDEEALVESRCVYTPVPILLNGRAPFGYRPSRDIRVFGAENAIKFDEGGRRGVLAIPGRAERKARHRGQLGVRVVVGGVWISTVEMTSLGRVPDGGDGVPLVGVVCDDSLRKTADQSDIVQDRRFVELLHAVQPRATQLIRSSAGPSWKPPELPILPDEDPDDPERPAGPAAEPLPTPVPSVEPRPPARLQQLQELPAGNRVFWTRPEDAAGLANAADLCRFPFPVLVLTPGQARTLSDQAPELSLAPLASTADVDFVRNALDRRQAVQSLEATIPLPGGRQGSLSVRLALEGGTPDPLRSVNQRVAFSAGARDASRWCGALELRLPGITAHVETPTDPDPDFRAALAERVVAEAWRFVLPGPDRVPDDAPILLALSCALLAESSQPLFVDRGERVELDLAISGLDPQQRDAALELPLNADSAGPLTLRQLLELQGSGRVIQLDSPSDREPLAPLEAILGWGHLSAAEDDAFPLCAVGCFAGGWRTMGRLDLSWKGFSHVLYAPVSYRTPSLLSDWVSVPLGLPVVGAVAAPDAPEEPDWDEGLAQLAKELRRLQRIDAWDELASTEVSVAQRRAMGGIALRVLSPLPSLRDRTERIPGAQGLPRSKRPESPQHPAVIPHGGIVVDDASLEPMWFDELLACERVLAPQRLRLGLDDDAATYAGPSQARDEGWVLRQELDSGGMAGWIGLRQPFDPTAAVLVQSSRSMHALHAGEQNVPVHGLVRLAPGQSEPSHDQEELLQLERLLLYQQLARLLDRPDLPPARREAAEHYASAFAVDAWRRGQLQRGSSRELAERIPFESPAGPTLLDWLGAATPSDPPARLHPAVLRFYRAGPIESQGVAKGPAELLQRFERALGGRYDLSIHLDVEYGKEGGELMRIADRYARSGPLFMLNLHSGLVSRAVDGSWPRGREQRADRRARDLILLEMAWRFARYARKRGHEVDLPAIHRALLASSLDG